MADEITNDDVQDVDAPAEVGDVDVQGDAGALGDPGKRALDSERQARKDAEKRVRELEARSAELEKASMGEHERALAEARETASAETAAKYTQRLAAARAEALAASRSHDPAAAVQLLGDLTTFVTEDGDVDADAMSAALDLLVESKPYLKAGAATAPVGGADQGPRRGARPQQLTRSDLARMSAQQIAEAKASGRLDDLLTGN